MENMDYKDLFTQNALNKLFPDDRTDRFFLALYGDATEGAYDIGVEFKEYRENKLRFEFQLRQRPEKCLACSLTFGLPPILARHPIIDVEGLVQGINHLLDGQTKCTDWQLGMTQVVSGEFHVISLTLFLDD